VTSGRFEKATKAVGVSNNFNSDQQTVLENEMIMILLGLESFANLEANLIRDAHLTQEHIQKVIEGVLKEVIVPIEHDLRTFLEKELQEETVDDSASAEGEVTSEASSADAPSVATEPSTDVKQETTESKTPVEEPKEEMPPIDEKTKNMRQLLRENSKTVNIKNLIASLEK